MAGGHNLTPAVMIKGRERRGVKHRIGYLGNRGFVVMPPVWQHQRGRWDYPKLTINGVGQFYFCRGSRFQWALTTAGDCMNNPGQNPFKNAVAHSKYFFDAKMAFLLNHRVL